MKKYEQSEKKGSSAFKGWLNLYMADVKKANYVNLTVTPGVTTKLLISGSFYPASRQIQD